MEKIELSRYNLYIGDIWEAFNRFVREGAYSKMIVLVDDNTREYCLPHFRKHAEHRDFLLIEIPSGEVNKNIDTCRHIWQSLAVAGIDRRALMVNLGGGVIGDMGGFCAATYKRGIDFVQMPTTLLSQVDASIGGKLGIDLLQLKNLVGLFHDPAAVFIDPVFLVNSDPREERSGFAEIIKHSLIGNAEQWVHLQYIRDIDGVSWEPFLSPSLQIKRRIVEQDPFEQGPRKALNFGHTIGHAVESLFLNSKEPLLHGEAIAMGMICEAYLSHRQAGLPADQLDRISHYLLHTFGKIKLPPKNYPEVIRLMGNDKKNEDQQINFTLINPVGTYHINQTAGIAAIEESLSYYHNLNFS